MCPATLRSPQMRSGRMPRMPATMAIILIPVQKKYCPRGGQLAIQGIRAGSCRSGERAGPLLQGPEGSAAAVHDAPALAHVELELVPKLLDHRHDRHRGGIAERAEG